MKSHYAFKLAHRRMILMMGLLLIGVFIASSTSLPAQDSETEMELTTDTLGTTSTATSDDDGTVKGNVSLVKRIESGGRTMIFLILLSIIGVTFLLERLVMLRRSAIVPAGLTDRALRMWEEKDFDGLLAMCREEKSTLSEVIRTLVRHRHCPAMELSMLAGDVAGRDMRRHMQKAYPLAIVATLAPLLGLFGTVIGILESFERVAIAGSMGDASILAGGISKALVTTATGLAIAVPALAAYHFFKMRTNELAMELEGEANDLLTTWFMTHPEDEE